ncbi:MAG: DUF86 domain-containing protein [Bacteroidales bacterium]|jgi:uncharacterized protein with HEPN domain|nr:DUF86 domain-containing protein [Bacteroidales bacterium]
MREPVKDRGRLEHILECINNINEFAEGKTFEQIEGDKMCYFAIVYQLVIIGEAANMLTKDFREARPQTPWREIVNMRNFIVHGYNVVDKNEVWSVIQDDLQPLKQQIENYIEELGFVEELLKDE